MAKKKTKKKTRKLQQMPAGTSLSATIAAYAKQKGVSRAAAKDALAVSGAKRLAATRKYDRKKR